MLPAQFPVLTDPSGRYRFAGWYEDEEFKIDAVPNLMLLSDITLYAKWIDEDEGPIAWFIGGIDTNTGANNGNNARAQTDLIKVQENGILEVTNMSEYTIVDMAVHDANYTYKGLTSKYTLTKSADNNTWTIKFTSFTGKYARFSVKRIDGANIALSEFNDTVITRS